MKTTTLPSQERLKYLFDYSPETGKFSRRVRVNNRPIGSTTKPHKSGYINQYVDGVNYRVHRLIWRYVTGEDPGALEIDHRDRNPSNNKWENLRKGTRKQQNENRGAKGFTWHKPQGKWHAQIMHERKRIHLGFYDCPLMAHLAYMDKKKELHSWGY